MNIQDIRLMHEYNYWSSAKILAAAAKVSPEQFTAPHDALGSLHSILVHLLDAEYGWRGLCETGVMMFDLKEADFPTLELIRQRWEETQKQWRQYLERLKDEDLSGIVRYEIEGGIIRERTLWHVLYHVVNHSTQHRSELAALLTEYGHSPDELDFTVFLNAYFKLPS
jgi:uncharacterized damage-inducible protein DinB